MKTSHKLFILDILIGLFLKCDKEEIGSRAYPRLHTLEVTDISNKGAMFSAEITFRGDFEILKYGFVWSALENPSIENSEQVVFSENIQSKKFSAAVSTIIEPKVAYFVRPFIVTENYTVYGNPVEFSDRDAGPPRITSFSPLAGSWGDTIQIVGNNFSLIKEKNIVKLGEIAAEVYAASDTLIYIRVPGVQNSSSVKISVNAYGNTAISDVNFSYLLPEINSIIPITGTFNDTITI